MFSKKHLPLLIVMMSFLVSCGAPSETSIKAETTIVEDYKYLCYSPTDRSQTWEATPGVNQTYYITGTTLWDYEDPSQDPWLRWDFWKEEFRFKTKNDAPSFSYAYKTQEGETLTFTFGDQYKLACLPSGEERFNYPTLTIYPGESGQLSSQETTPNGGTLESYYQEHEGLIYRFQFLKSSEGETFMRTAMEEFEFYDEFYPWAENLDLSEMEDNTYTCTDSQGQEYTSFFVYPLKKLPAIDKHYIVEEMGLAFDLAPPMNAFLHIGDEFNGEQNSIFFDDVEDVNCVSIGIAVSGTLIQKLAPGGIEAQKEILKNETQMDSGIRTFGSHTFDWVLWDTFGTGAYDEYFIEHQGQEYSFLLIFDETVGTPEPVFTEMLESLEFL